MRKCDETYMWEYILQGQKNRAFRRAGFRGVKVETIVIDDPIDMRPSTSSPMSVLDKADKQLSRFEWGMKNTVVGQFLTKRGR